MDRFWYRGGFYEKLLEVPEELKPMERTHVEEVHGGFSSMGGTQAGAGKDCEEFLPGEEGTTEAACDELTRDPIPHIPESLGRKRERTGSEVEPGKKRGVRGRCFKVY